MQVALERAGAYTLDVVPPREPGGEWRWEIRHRGKLMQRSDRGHASEAKAVRDGEAMVRRVQSNVEKW